LPPPAGGSAETQTESCHWSDNGPVNNAGALGGDGEQVEAGLVVADDA